MNKLFSIFFPFFLFAFTSNYTQNLNYIIKDINCSQELHNIKYDVCYSYKRKTPLVTAYEIKKEYLEGNTYKRPSYFKSDYRIPKKYRSYNNNYTHQGYDRGHLVSNAIFNTNKKLQKETFIMSNVVPHYKKLNRGVWKKIERLARFLATKYNKVEVITGVCGNKGYIKNKIIVPKYMYKIIYINDLNKTISFLVPNENVKSKIKDYKVNVKEIKEKCDF